MSEAVVAPHCSITSGATGLCDASVDTRVDKAWGGRTPVGAPDDSVVARSASRCRIARDTKVGKLDGTIFGCQDVGALDVAVNNALIVQVH
jgi:hypothetical protein